MPIYDYRCEQCQTVYEVFHKVREVKEDIVCPSCSSPRATRLLSAPSISVAAAKADLPPCGDAGCCGGKCPMN